VEFHGEKSILKFHIIVSVSQLADSSGLQTTLIESLGNNKPSKVEEPEENSLIRY
jgi:hypothetical protein